MSYLLSVPQLVSFRSCLNVFTLQVVWRYHVEWVDEGDRGEEDKEGGCKSWHWGPYRERTVGRLRASWLREREKVRGERTSRSHHLPLSQIQVTSSRAYFDIFNQIADSYSQSMASHWLRSWSSVNRNSDVSFWRLMSPVRCRVWGE